MDKRICNKCHTDKPLEHFYRDKAQLLGRDYTCKECRKESNRERDRERDKRPERILKAKKWLQSEKGKERARQRYRQNYKINKQRYSAQRAVKRLIKAGAIIRQPCEICSEKPSNGHHPNYSKPLVVVWLCQKHHAEAHRK